MFGLSFVKSKEIQNLREVLTNYERTLEDIGWINLTQDQTSLPLIGESFKKMLKRVKLYYTRNPLAGQWVRLTTDFVFGEGLAKPEAKDKAIQEVIDKFWEDPDNKISLTSYEAQQKLGNKLQYEGNLFFAMFDDDEGNVRIRILDTHEIEDVIRDAEDRMRPIFYKKGVKTNKYNFGSDSYEFTFSEYAYYPDYNIFDAKAYDVPEKKLRDEAYIFHVKVNCDINDKFGIPELYRGIDWMKAHKDMAGDLATLIKALSKFAWKKKVKGTAAQVNSLKNLMQAKSDLSNIGATAGSTQIENQALDMKAISTPTGGAVIGEKGLKQMILMVCAASGIFHHYYGDPSTGNLATAKTMELPMIKKFSNYQKLWEGIYGTILQYAINKKIEAGLLSGKVEDDPKNKRKHYTTKLDRTLDIDFPPILEVDLETFGKGLEIGKNNKFISDELASRLFLLAANVNNVEEEVKKATEEREKEEVSDEEKAKELEKQMALKKENDLKEAIDAPKKTPGIRFAKKNNYIKQRMSGYARALAYHFKAFQKAIDSSVRHSGEPGKVVGIVENFDASLVRFERGMKTTAREYFPIAIDIGKKFLQAHLLKEVKIYDTLFEAEGRAKTLLQEKLDWNDKFIATSLIPDMKKKISGAVKMPYQSEAELKETIGKAVNSFESRVEQYSGAFWTVEEAAVKEAGKGTELKANFAGADDSGTCEGCDSAMSGNPYPISEAPEPGSFECNGRCRHALQIVETE